MSDWGSKTRNAGPPPRDRRREEPRDKRHLSPHHKPRTYLLTVTYVATLTETCTKKFTSKAAMREFRARVEREMAKAKAAPPRKSYRYWGQWYNTDLKMDSEQRKSFSEEPEITETLIDGSAVIG